MSSHTSKIFIKWSRSWTSPLSCHLNTSGFFEEQAKDYSEDLSSASEGGDLGWAAPSAFQRLYGNAVDDLQDGQMSQPFKAGAGWYLVKRIGSRQTDQTEEFKRNRARQILFRRKFDEEQEAWMREIREQAYVKILDEELKD